MSLAISAGPISAIRFSSDSRAKYRVTTSGWSLAEDIFLPFDFEYDILIIKTYPKAVRRIYWTKSLSG